MTGYQLKVTIKDSHPPIWRRIIVPSHISFRDLDDIIEEAFGWTHDHMFAFDFNGYEIEFVGTPIPSEDDTVDECIDEWMDEGETFLYTYDFGDDWMHTVKVEKIVEYDKRYPVVIKAKGPNMIEDCGGIWNFYEYMDQAEPFDMEAVNKEFSKWDLDEVIANPYTDDTDFLDNVSEKELMDLLISSMMDPNEENRKKFDQVMKLVGEQEENIRKTVPAVQSLEDIFQQYTKENLKQIAQAYGFTGYNKFKKNELAQWLKNHLLEIGFMKKQLLHLSEIEWNIFKNAIGEQGISMSKNMIEDSLFLSTYGGYLSEKEFYVVPLDVKEKYEKICTPEFQAALDRRRTFMIYCDASAYLYGVLTVEKLTEIYNFYEKTDLKVSETEELIEDFIQAEEPYVLKQGLFMDENLNEQELYQYVLKKQQPYSYYLPENKEEFLDFGRFECQKPDENTEFFLKYIQKKQHKKAPEDLMLFYRIQDGLRMNGSVEDIITEMISWGCKISSQKQVKELLNHINELDKHVRKWDYKGHTKHELKDSFEGKATAGLNNIVKFPAGNKIYPNDPCPCGSGKKYKHCCGKQK